MEEDTSTGSYTGFLTFRVISGKTYYFSALGSRVPCSGFVFTESAYEPTVTFLATEELPEETFTSKIEGVQLAAGDDFKYEGIWYTVIDADAKTVKTKDRYYENDGFVSGNTVTGDVTIPSVVSDGFNDYIVIGIGDGSFEECDELISVSLPNTLKYIENLAFSGCDNLASIILPSSLEEIGIYCFASCPSLTEISIPEKVTKIPHGAIEACRSLEKVTLPEGLTEIDINSFLGCYNLTSVNMPASLRRIGGAGFDGCALTSIELPPALEYLGDIAFQGNPLVSVIIPASLQEVDERPFLSCYDIREVTYLAEIPRAFEETFFEFAVYDQATLNTPNASLAAIQETVPWNRFARIQASDGSIGFISAGDDFEYEGIWYTVIDPEAKTCKTKEGRYDYENNTTVAGNDCQGNIVIPERVSDGYDYYTVTEIGRYSFSGCSRLMAIEIPGSVTSIGNSTFENCTSLTSIELPANLTSISERV